MSLTAGVAAEEAQRVSERDTDGVSSPLSIAGSNKLLRRG